jgi:hypothetical protein
MASEQFGNLEDIPKESWDPEIQRLLIYGNGQRSIGASKSIASFNGDLASDTSSACGH